MKIYPYRTRTGAKNLLQATDIHDARNYLRQELGEGVMFCETQIDDDVYHDLHADADIAAQVDAFLEQSRNVRIT